MRTRVKICGITRPEDALAAARLGADAIGLVFYADSPRRVGLQQAAEIVAALPPFVTRVGLFVDAEDDDVNEALAAIPIDTLQFHGDEPAEYCRQFDRPYIKAIRMQAHVNLPAQAQVYGDSVALLVDTYIPDVAGGTGQSFDWARLPHDLAKPIILAGGLTADNVGLAIEQARPYAVDVSGGVEQAKGVKDQKMMQAFINEVAKYS